MLNAVENAGYRGFGEAIDAELLITPADWAKRGLGAGTPFAAAHTFGQTGPFRSPTPQPERGVAGSSTTPGVGVPVNDQRAILPRNASPAPRAYRSLPSHSKGVPGDQIPPELAAAYQQCRRIHLAHGRTYYLATRLLPRERRPHVWALYAFARVTDDLVDAPGHREPASLHAWRDRAMAALLSPSRPDPACLPIAGSYLADVLRPCMIPICWPSSSMRWRWT